MQLSPRSAGVDVTSFWEHSLACALIARNLARKLGYPDAERAYLAGLVHDRPQPPPRVRIAPRSVRQFPAPKVVCIGTSTGGAKALQLILPLSPATLAVPIVSICPRVSPAPLHGAWILSASFGSRSPSPTNHYVPASFITCYRLMLFPEKSFASSRLDTPYPAAMPSLPHNPPQSTAVPAHVLNAERWRVTSESRFVLPVAYCVDSSALPNTRSSFRVNVCSVKGFCKYSSF